VPHALELLLHLRRQLFGFRFEGRAPEEILEKSPLPLKDIGIPFLPVLPFAGIGEKVEKLPLLLFLVVN
jgi:hypothetical protein